MPGPTPSTSPATPAAALLAAMDDAVGCSISLQSDSQRIHRHARIVAVRDQEVHIEIVHVAAEAAVLDTLKAEADLVATLCLRVPDDELVCFARVIRIGEAVAAEADSVLQPRDPQPQTLDVILAMPDEIIATRRRESFRVAVAAEDHVALKLWRIDSYAVLRDQPPPSQSFKCALCDLSADGMRAIVWAGRIKALSISEGQRFRAVLQCDEEEILLDARLRHPRSTLRDQEFAWCGFEFVLNDADFNSRRNRQKLEKILARLQRSAAKRLAA